MAYQDTNQADHTSELADSKDRASERFDTMHPGTKRTERVFPIRVHVQKIQQPKQDRNLPSLETVAVSGSAIHDPTLLALPDERPSISDEESAAPLVSNVQVSEAIPSPGNRYITNKFTYIQRRDCHNNKSATLSATGEKTYRCEDEPIHIPGAIQRFGALIAVRVEDDSFLVRVASENSHSIIGIEPEALFQLRCFTDILHPPDREEFITRAHAVSVDTSRKSPDIFSILLAIPFKAPISVFCAMHLNTESDFIICEFESDKDIIDPGHLSDCGFPQEPVQINNDGATDEERLLSTTCRSKPIHSLEIARATSRQLTLIDVFQIHSEIQAQVSSATTLPHLGDVIVGLVHDLTGFHRVMFYQFDDTAAGSVVSELIDLRASKDLYRGLHFPSSDIPKQARELYMTNTIRVLYDREKDTARLICRTLEDAKIPLNLTHSYLRAMSPVHLKYLANMGVQASMSISLIADNKLWGLISCHNYGSGSGIHISLPIREICRGIGNIASSNIQKLLFSSRMGVRRHLAEALHKASPSAYVTSSTADLLNMFGADLGFLVLKEEARMLGQLFAYNEAIVILQYVRQRAQSTIFYSHSFAKDFPDLHFAPGFSLICGMLVIPLSLSGTDFLVFLRKGKLKEIKWAGNPYGKQAAAGTNYLEPRSNFKRWRETVIGTSREWTEDEVQSATILTTLYERFIEVWRQKEAVVQRNRMTRLLIRNAGHEVRTPLNSIINYLEVALEGEVDEGSRYHLQKSLQASKSLVFVVNDLLRLTEAGNSDFQVHEDNVNLRSMLSEVVAAFREEGLRRNLQIRIEDDQDVSEQVRCDPNGLRQVASNLLANALQSSDSGHIAIALQHIQTTETSSMIKISFTDCGTGLSEEQLDSIFQDFEQVLDNDDIFASGKQGEERGMRPLQIGLGLAVAARFVRLHSGQISMSSEGEGKGTTVSITIPFRKALSGDFSRRRTSTHITLPTPPSDTLSPKGPKTPGSASSTSTPLRTDGPLTSASSLESSMARYRFPILSGQHDRPKFNVLAAEDNPLNSRLLETRLKRRGHVVQIAVDGRACVKAFENKPDGFDIILMDIQMPVVDGIEATRMIREFEKESSSAISLSPRVASYGRIPIVAVSASLSEQHVYEYVEIGFDGWILKPIDFKRLEAIFAAIEDEQTRGILLYGAGSWEKGGWLKVKSEG